MTHKELVKGKSTPSQNDVTSITDWDYCHSNMILPFCKRGFSDHSNALEGRLPFNVTERFMQNLGGGKEGFLPIGTLCKCQKLFDEYSIGIVKKCLIY